MQELKCAVQESITLHNIQALAIVEFSHAKLKKDQNRIKYELYKGDVINQKFKKILVASTKHLQYSGTNYDRDMFKITFSKLKVAVFNKCTKKMKLFEADYFLLKPISNYNLEIPPEEKNLIEKHTDLILNFGTKTKKNFVNSRRKFQASADLSIDESLLNNVSLNLQPAIEGNQSSNSQSDSIIPLPNKDAKDVTQIYNIFDIISQEEYTALDSDKNIFKDIPYDTIQSWKAEQKYCDIIMRYLDLHYQVISDYNAKLLCYLHYMFCFLKTNSKEFRRKDPIPEVPQPYKKKLMHRYVLNKSLPQRMKDKLLADAIVLYLNINNFCIDGKLLASSTKISMKRLVDIAHALGCHVHSAKNEDIKRIELKLPLYTHVPFGRKK